MSKRIPISAAEKIAKQYGYDQVLIVARKVGEDGKEHITSYGVNKEHCDSAAKQADALKRLMNWKLISED
jgi:predicted Fe-Mo cluster-binding NifX family protein